MGFRSVFNARKTCACVIGPLMKQGLDSASHLAVPLIKTRPRLFAFFSLRVAPHAWIIKGSVTCLGQAAVFCLFCFPYSSSSSEEGSAGGSVLLASSLPAARTLSVETTEEATRLVGGGRLQRATWMDRIMTHDVEDYTLYPLCPADNYSRYECEPCFLSLRDSPSSSITAIFSPEIKTPDCPSAAFFRRRPSKRSWHKHEKVIFISWWWWLVHDRDLFHEWSSLLSLPVTLPH